MNDRIRNIAQKGQTIVETALVLPFLVMLVAGVVEFSNLAQTQNRVSTAARNAARFIVNGGKDEGVPVIVINTVTQTLSIDEARWDIWAIRGEIDSSGTAFTSFRYNHVFGLNQTHDYAVTAQALGSNQVRSEILAQLQKDANGGGDPTLASGQSISGALVLFDTQSILRLDAFSELVEAAMTIRQLQVVRRISMDINQTGGRMGVMPIGIQNSISSVK